MAPWYFTVHVSHPKLSNSPLLHQIVEFSLKKTSKTFLGLQQLSAGVSSLITTHHTGTLILRSATCSQTSTWLWFQAQAEPSPNAPRMEPAAPWMLQSVLESSSESS